MRKQKWLALLLALCLVMTTGCALIEKDETVDRATTVVSVYDKTYTKGEVQDATDYNLSYMAYIYSMYGYSYDTTDEDNIADIRNSVIDSWIESTVLDHQASVQGLDQLTDEETAELNETIESDWASVRSSVQSYYLSDSELEGDELEAAIDAKAAELGYSKDDYAESDRSAYIQDKLEASVKDAVTVTDDELQAELDELAADAKETYESNPAAYGTAVVNGNTVYYRPAGYRNIKNLLLQFNEDDSAVLTALESRKSDADTAITTATTALTDLGVEDVDSLVACVTVSVTGEPYVDPDAVTGTVEETAEAPAEETAAADEATPSDLAEATPSDLTETETETVAETVAEETVTALPNLVAKAEVTANTLGSDVTAEVSEQVIALATAKAESEFYADQITDCTALAYAHLDERADAALARLEAGESFDTVMTELTEDPGMQEGATFAATGYPVSADSTNWDTSFRDAAMALANVGDYSGKVTGSYGYYIVQYASDVEEGPVALSEVYDQVKNTVLSDKQEEAWDAQVDAWVSEANAKIDLSCFNN